MEVWLWKQQWESVLQPQALEAFFFQASQSVSEVPLIVCLDQVKGPSAGKHLKVGHQPVNKLWVIILATAVAPASRYVVKL
jgi:hypothetical protein